MSVVFIFHLNTYSYRWVLSLKALSAIGTLISSSPILIEARDRHFATLAFAHLVGEPFAVYRVAGASWARCGFRGLLKLDLFPLAVCRYTRAAE